MKKYNHIIIKYLFGLFFVLPGFLQVVGQDNSESEPDVLRIEANTALPLVTVKGQILDVATKLPVLGARIQSRDQQFSAISDENGLFTIEVPEHLSRLFFSAPDYASVEYPLQNQSELKIFLYRFLPPLRSQSALVANEEMQTLSGGYIRSITRSGTPAMGSSMFIRGFNSLNAGAQPLIVIDGIVFDNQYDRVSIHDGYILNPLSNISVDDIDEIRVIKDGSSLYGAKAGNGVLLINTKRGKDPVTKITVSALGGYNEKPQAMSLLNADQFRVYASDILKGVYNDPSQLSALPFLREDLLFYDYNRYHNSNDWSKNVYKNSFTQSYNVGVSGGDDVALYHLSMGYTNANSTLKENDFTRFNARFNSDVELTSKFRFSFDLAYSQTDRNLRDDGIAESFDLLTSPSILSKVKAPFLIPYEHSNTGSVTSDISDYDFFGIANPVAILDKGIGESSLDYLALSIKPVYKFTKEFKLSGVFNYSQNTLFEKYFRPDEGLPTVYLSDVEGSSRNFVKAQNTKQISLTADIQADWNKQIDIHHLNLTGGFRFLTDSYKGDFGSGHNTANDLDHNLNGSLAYKKTTGYDDKWRSFSWYLNAGYGLYDKYFLSILLSADASSRYGKEADMAFKVAGANWGLYPSADLSWLVSSENFMKNVSFINFMKLRLGYGLFGNDNIPQEGALSYFSSIRYINEFTGLTLANIGNLKLKPELVEKKTLGMDLGLFNNRLSLSADVFHHTTSDLLTLKQFKNLVGKDAYWANDGKLENKGYELTFNLKALVLPDFQWEIGASAAHYKNKILELPDGDYITSIYGGEIKTAIGHPAGVFYGYKTDGVFATTQDAVDAGLKILDYTGLGYIPFEAGDVRFVDLHDDGVINEKDKTVIGDPNPDLTGMFNTRISYKKLTLSALFTYSYGNDVYNYLRSQLESGSSLINQTSALQNRWVSEGQQTSIPRISYRDPMGNGRFSDRWIEDGSYLRLKTVSISYDVPVNWIFLSGFTIWISANNLWTYTKYLGSDPEFSINNSVLYQGIDAGFLSQGRSYFVGLKLNL